ncbi:hypothetical protein [Rhizobium mulingense]|uniref:Uncharacterized protein n=1 Tax=Rhizobium mulingense TaxID=3031128 RepID=A0ACC6N2D2_9HYPH|nr:hypothetical protein [Rhizobium sp. MJ31]MEA3519819.1 hypothetical protein [Rhizobium sp. MJ31]
MSTAASSRRVEGGALSNNKTAIDVTPVILVCSQDAELYLLLAHILHGDGFEARLAVSDHDVVGACTAAEIAAVLLDCAGWPSDVAPLCALLKDSGVSVGALISGGMRAQHLQFQDHRVAAFRQTYQLLIIGELGSCRTGAELLFELISQRYERSAILIISDLSFDECA